MNRWNIEQIILYSHDERLRRLEMRPGQVNIITGDSGTGKSALVQVIDYCLGSKDCEIADFVKIRCSWVGTLWARGLEHCFIARKVPGPREQTTRRFYLLTGSNIRIPDRSSELPQDGGETGALARFSALMGISEASSETFGADTRDSFAISSRHTLPFLLQSDTAIISSKTLFWGGLDAHRQAIIDTLPYFLGAVDARNAAARRRLSDLRREARRLERREQVALRTEDHQSEYIDELLTEAAGLGMTPQVLPVTAGERLGLVASLANWDVEGQHGGEGGSRLVQLQEKERCLSSEFWTVDRQIKDTERLMRDARDFEGAATGQAGRLESVGLIKPHSPVALCPFCETPLERTTEPIEHLRQGLAVLGNDLSCVNREIPRVEGILDKLVTERQRVQTELREVRTGIRTIVAEDETLSAQRSLDSIRNQLVGKAKQAQRIFGCPAPPTDRIRLDELRSEIADLEAQIDPETLRGRVAAITTRIDQFANVLLPNLPFDDAYRRATASFNPRTLTTSLVLDGRIIEMPSIGSDENYLSLHVAFILSLHKVFGEGGRPVPGLVIFDQVSRPYFPPDQNPKTVDLDNTSRTDEREKVQAIFNVLFEEVSAQNSMQVIVLEHACFPGDARFMGAVREQWPKGTGLVPVDWPPRG